MKSSKIDPSDIAAIGAMRNLVLQWDSFDPLAVDENERDSRLATAIWQYGYSWTDLCLAVHQELCRLRDQRPDRYLDRPDVIRPVEGKSELEAWEEFQAILLSINRHFDAVIQQVVTQSKLDTRLAAKRLRELHWCEDRDARFAAIFAKRYPKKWAA